MKTQIDEIVKIKEYRETAAMNEVAKCENLLKEAVQLVKRKKKELTEYQEWRVKKEDKLYNDILKKKVYVRDLEHLRQEVIELRLKEDDYKKAVDEAVIAKNRALEALEEARKAYTQAVINTQKMQEIAKTLAEEEEIEAIRFEESELEEQAISVSIGPREEWDA